VSAKQPKKTAQGAGVSVSTAKETMPQANDTIPATP
jgi:hypothetical protein